MIQAAIFDFDGTLTELTLDFDYLKAEVIAVAKQYVPEETIRLLDGFYILELIDELERRLGDRGARMRQEALDRLTVLELESSKGKDVYAYTRHVLRELKKRGIKTGIITRTTTRVLNQVFTDMDEYVDVVLAREHVKLLKPHPGHVLDMARILSVPAETSLIVGDHPSDVKAGREAGAMTAGVLSGRTTREAFEAEKADFILADIRGVLDIV